MLSNELICSAAAVCHLRQRKESAPFSRHPLVHYLHPLSSSFIISHHHHLLHHHHHHPLSIWNTRHRPSLNPNEENPLDSVTNVASLHSIKLQLVAKKTFLQCARPNFFCWHCRDIDQPFHWETIYKWLRREHITSLLGFQPTRRLSSHFKNKQP